MRCKESSSLMPQVLLPLPTNGEVSMQEEMGEIENSKDIKKGSGQGMLADPPVRGLVYHAVLYLGVVLSLLAVNLRTAPDSLWVVWIALIWGLILVWNAWQVFQPGRNQR
ncbi:2TM domain-containing protein [Methanogenium marinum]|uniref:2TM domain-containing protein n=1 Tax=Methanogenium marinum TaxID=348610 RepID=A0A9Q4KTC4_9EURY|nr:2TM domain-containing protein [Methanogenium marinum]MDE4908432.1 2TM domain-containing protein [Methanogenium marinum]